MSYKVHVIWFKSKTAPYDFSTSLITCFNCKPLGLFCVLGISFSKKDAWIEPILVFFYGQQYRVSFYEPLSFWSLNVHYWFFGNYKFGNKRRYHFQVIFACFNWLFLVGVFLNNFLFNRNLTVTFFQRNVLCWWVIDI